MKYSQEEILKALKVIRDVCEEQRGKCSYCPFGNDRGWCIISESDPDSLKFNEINEEPEKVWRAIRW